MTCPYRAEQRSNRAWFYARSLNYIEPPPNNQHPIATQAEYIARLHMHPLGGLGGDLPPERDYQRKIRNIEKAKRKVRRRAK